PPVASTTIPTVRATATPTSHRRRCTSLSQSSSRHFHIVERHGAFADDLILLVSFSCDEHQIAWLRRTNGTFNGEAAIRNALVRRAGTPRRTGFGRGIQTADDFVENALRIFRTRIVRGENDSVTQTRR